MINKKHYRKGYTMTEIMIVLSVLAIIFMVILYSYQSLRKSSQVKAEAQYAIDMAGGIKSLYVGKTNFKGVDSKVLIDSQIAPKANIVSQEGGKKVLNHNMLGTLSENSALIEVAEQSKENNPSFNFFTLTYYNVPSSKCSEFTSIVSSVFDFIEIDGNNIKNFNNNFKVSDSIEACHSSKEVNIKLGGK